MESLKRISEAKIEYLLIIFFALMLLPFLLLNYYNHPTPEDFVYGEEAKRYGFLESYSELYNHWGGRFFTYIFLLINPLLFKSIEAYKVTTFILMITFFYALFLFISEITRNSLAIRERFLLSLSIFFLYLFAMPSVSQGFYWYGSAVCYHLSIILIFLFFIFYIRLNGAGNFPLITFYVAATSLTAMAIAGSNELAAALILIFIVVAIIKKFFIEKHFEWSLIIIGLSIVLGLYISFSAPGNYERAGQYPENHKLFFSVYNSFSFLIQSVISWSFNTPLWAITFLLIPILFKIVNNSTSGTGIFSINPLYFLIVYFTFLFISIFIMLWSVGIFPYDRILNLIYFIFLIGWFCNIIALISYINKKYKINPAKIPQYVYAITFVIIVLFLFRENNIGTAYSELLGGAASSYNNEMNKRYDFISQNKLDSFEIDGIESVPKTFFLLDITSDPEIFYNEGYARYFNKKSISLKKVQ